MARLSKLGFLDIDIRRTTDPVRRRVRSRGVPPALADREIFYTEDPHEASELLGRAFAPNRLTLREFAAAGFAATMHGARLREVSLLHVDLAVAVELEIAASGPYVAVHMPMNGRTVVETAGTSVEATPIRAAVTSPGAPVTMRFDHDSPHLVVRIERDALERHLTRLLGRSLDHPVAFAAEMDLTSDAAVRWHAAVQLLHTEVFHPGSLVRQGIGFGPLEEFLMSTLLLLQPSNYQQQLVLQRKQPGRRAVRLALGYIEEHLSEPITMADLAAAAQVSVRSIQEGFRDELGVSPTAYIRDRRLERARADLVDAEPADGVTVSEVAYRWGFNHLGNFSALYRHRFGESPSQTLRR
ncbi:MAG: AraC family transcriptional regulator [Frankia sp.]|nr:AraC family transcriptional regulator [Frankia sp.]